MVQDNVIAIDGPAASGKSTAAKNLAKALGIAYINTGSMFRAIAWKALQNGISCRDVAGIEELLKSTSISYSSEEKGAAPEICIDGIYPGQALRSAEVAQGASDVAVIPAVRAFTLELQRDMAKDQLVVMEGRDIGTVVFPNAKYKFFLTASPKARAYRRLTQGGETPDGSTLESVAAEIAERDKQDSERPIAPLKQADDAILIDSSDNTQEETLQKLLALIEQKNTVSVSK